MAPRGDLGRLRNSDRGHDLRGHLRGLPRGQRGPQRPQQRGRLPGGGLVGEAAGARVEVAGAHRARAREVPGGGVSCGRWRRGVVGHGVTVTAPPLARLWSWPAPLLPTGGCCPARTLPPRARWGSPAVSGTAARRSGSAGRIHDEGAVVLLDHRRRRVVNRGHQPGGNSARGCARRRNALLRCARSILHAGRHAALRGLPPPGACGGSPMRLTRGTRSGSAGAVGWPA